MLTARKALMLAGTLGIACATSDAKSIAPTSVVLRDADRGREVPIQVTLSKRPEKCTSKHPCPVAVISGGYGVPYTAYSFIANALSELDYTVVSIQHDLTGDAPLARHGDLHALRMPVWTRGADNILFVRSFLARQHQNLDFDHLTLVGHSNGGDLSLVFAQRRPDLVSAVVTLDHRRVPIPRSRAPRILSVRSSDTPPIPGVVPNAEEQAAFGITVRQLPDARHNDMHDGGGETLKDNILRAIVQFLSHNRQNFGG
jgi:pimeloyl-ACP methyl ester carboxylesterase